MYQSFKDESPPLQIKIPWDRNTARGFCISLLLVFLAIMLSPVIELDKPEPFEYEINTIPIEILNFGAGDGTGMSKGNLAEEGAQHKGAKTPNELDDAKIAAKGKTPSRATTDDIESATNFIARKDFASSETNNSIVKGTGNKNIGSPDGSETGTGLGDKGFGPGKGLGLGDIEWGGGGNRTVLYKKLPQYPKGINTNAQIRIKFTVSTDGTVSSMVPLQKGDPVLEKAAMDALRQWRFNPLGEEKLMFGIITFTFRVS